jgi:maltose O-acetyltransferase
MVRVLNYLTNRVVAHVPSHTLRRWWYRRVVGVRIGSGSSIHLGLYLWFFGPGHLRRTGAAIGNNSIVNRNCCLDGRGPLHIGNNVSISPDVTILTTQHRYDDPAFGLVSAPVALEDHAWIGMRAMIMPGVRVGRGAVVAAAAVVTRDVEPLTIVAGVPARVVGRRRCDPSYELADLSPLFE